MGEKTIKIDELGRIEIPTILLNKLELRKEDNIVVEVDNGIIFLSKKD